MFTAGFLRTGAAATGGTDPFGTPDVPGFAAGGALISGLLIAVGCISDEPVIVTTIQESGHR
jgi:hypothetical protein